MYFLPHVVLLACSMETYSCEVNVLPPFKPNKYLLDKHRKPGQKDWEVFAWAVRDIMAKHGGLKLNDQPLAEKILYKDFMNG